MARRQRGGAGEAGTGERRRVGREDTNVEARPAEQVGERDDEAARQQEHVEQQRADGRDAEMPRSDRAGWRTRLNQAKRMARSTIGATSARIGWRRSVHDAIRLAAMPSGTARSHRPPATTGRDAKKDQRRVVAPLEEAVEDALHGKREHDAEDGAGDRDERAFGEHLHEDAPACEPDEAQRSHGSAPLVHEHHHQRQQEHGAAEDGDDGDRQVEALDDDECAGALVRRVGRSRRQRRQTRGDVTRERASVRRMREGDVD